MALTEIDYPVTGSFGSYQNTFPSQKPLYANFNRKDGLMASVSSGTNSKLRIEFSTALGSINVGQFVTFESDGYPLQSAKVLVLVDSTTIDVDVPFTSGNAANGFVNYKRNYILEIRYVLADSSSNDQAAIELIEDYSQKANARNGDIKANISTPSQLLVADFDISGGTASGLSITYKIQFRESFEGERAGTWISPVLDIAILLVHGSMSITAGEYTDPNIIKRYFKGFPLVYSFIYSAINDEGSNSIRLVLSQFDISQSLISESDVATAVNLNGVYILSVDTTGFDEDTAFLKFSHVVSTSNAQYDGDQYDPDQYA